MRYDVKKLLVLNSDAINRYGYRFSVRTLKSCIDQRWISGTPSCISHDSHRPFAWTHPFCLYFEPGLVRLVGLISIPETEQEKAESILSAKNYFLKNMYDKVAPKISTFRSKIGNHLSGTEKYYYPGCPAVCDDGLAKKVFSNVFSKQDNDGLIPIRLLKAKAPGVYEIDGLLLFAHSFFRRSLSRMNVTNEVFLNILQELAKDDRSEIKIALDEDMIGLASNFKQTIELEYWWGPKFSDNLADIPKGVTVHQADDQLKFYHGISKAEF